MSKTNDDRQNIVIVGGGGGGATTARLLSSMLDPALYNIILINPRPYLIAWPATLRAVVSETDGLEEKIFVPLHNIFHNHNGTFLQGKVEFIESDAEKGGSVTLQDGEVIRFHILVLSPGSIWAGPIAFPEHEKEVKEFMRNSRATFDNAQNIVLAGGGAVGIELAGEIKDKWPSKKVTIVHGNKALLNDAYPTQYRNRIERRLHAYGVDVILDDHIDDLELIDGMGIKTRNGRKLPADLVLSTTGPRPNTDFIVASLGGHTVTNRGFVKIRPTLQLRDYPNIFALGDIIDWNEQKQIAKAYNHASIVANNIQASLSGHALQPYNGSSEMIVVTIGKNAGVTYLGILWGIIMGDWVSALLKSRTLRISNLRAALGQ